MSVAAATVVPMIEARSSPQAEPESRIASEEPAKTVARAIGEPLLSEAELAALPPEQKIRYLEVEASRGKLELLRDAVREGARLMPQWLGGRRAEAEGRQRLNLTAMFIMAGVLVVGTIATLVLALTHVLSGETVGTLLGLVLGSAIMGFRFIFGQRKSEDGEGPQS
jgi:hypothetical protein